MSLPTPNTRKEQYLNAIATGNASGLPTPITREEEYLDAIAKSGGGSGEGDMKKSVYDSDLDVAGAGGIKAFVNSAVAGKVDKIEGKGLSTNDYTDADKAIVDGVTSALTDKVDKVEGKGLSTNDYTDEDKAIVDGVTDALAEKADTEDIPDLVSDNLAKGIFGNETVLSTDIVPFVSKIMNAGKYQRKKFVGCSFVWNQIVVANAKTATYTWDTDTSAYTELAYSLLSDERFTIITDHIYLIGCNISRTISTNDQVSVGIREDTTTLISVWVINGEPDGHVVRIHKATTTGNAQTIYFNNYGGKRGFNVGDTVSYDNLILIDLTQLFGSTAIADYIYNLEQATAGAGVAKLKELGFFTENYYAYDPGSVQSVDIKEYAVTGKNLFNGNNAYVNFFVSESSFTVSSGGYYKDIFTGGTGATSQVSLATINKLPLLAAGTYIITWQNGSVLSIRAVNNDGSIKSTIINNASSGSVFTLTEPTRITLRRVESSTDRTFNNLQIEISSTSTATEYEPYHKTTYPLTPTELKGVPKIDANNNIYCDGDEYASDGTVARKYVIADISTLNLSKSSASTSTMAVFRADISDIKPVKNTTTIPNLVCANFIAQACTTSWAIGRMTFASYQGAPLKAIFFITDPSYTSVEDFIAAMSGKYIVYEKDTPTTENLTPFDYPQSVGSLEEIVDYKVEQEQRDVTIPTGHVTEYMGKGGEFTLPTLPETPSVLAFDGHNFYWKPETA